VKGIRRDQWGYRAYVKIGSVQRGRVIQREKRFPPDTPTKKMQDWRDETKVALRALIPHPVQPGSL
jgi:hypothetical protein